MSITLSSSFASYSRSIIDVDAGLLQYRVTPDMVPPTFPFQLTTKVLAAICPRLAKFYPDNKAELIVNVTSTPKVRFVEGKGVDITIDGVLSVKTSR